MKFNFYTKIYNYINCNLFTFNETIDLIFLLRNKNKQQVTCVCNLPYTFKSIKVICIVTSYNANLLRSNLSCNIILHVDIYNFKSILSFDFKSLKSKKSILFFDFKSYSNLKSKYLKIFIKKGFLIHPLYGTVSNDVVNSVNNLVFGSKIFVRNLFYNKINLSIGKVYMDFNNVYCNFTYVFNFLRNYLVKLKTGIKIISVILKSTQGTICELF